MGRNALMGRFARLGNLGHAFHQRFGGHDKQLGHLLLERHGADALVHSSTRGGCGVFGILTVTSAFAACLPRLVEHGARGRLRPRAVRPVGCATAQGQAPPGQSRQPDKTAAGDGINQSSHTTSLRTTQSPRTTQSLRANRARTRNFTYAHQHSARNALRQRATARCRST